MCSYIASIEPQHTGGRWPTGLVGEQINFMSNEGINWSFVCIVKHMLMHMHRSKSRLFTQDMSIRFYCKKYKKCFTWLKSTLKYYIYLYGKVEKCLYAIYMCVYTYAYIQIYSIYYIMHICNKK